MNVAILALDGCPLSAVSGPLEILSLAKSLSPSQGLFKIEILGESKNSISCLGGIQLQPHSNLQTTNNYNMVILGPIGQPTRNNLAFNKKTLNWIRNQHSQGADIVSICTGAYLFAATGLLNGKIATTHWAYAKLFEQLFPEVTLQPDKMITQDGKLFCSGGASAYQDMAIFLVKKHFGEDIAQHCAKNLLIDPNRINQNQYASFIPARQHQDSKIHDLQNWLDIHALEAIPIAKLADKICLSERQLKRRFKQATSETPLTYIHGLRIEHAKQCLVKSNKIIEAICRESGYEDISFFRQLFKRFTGLSPTEYRKKFRLH